VNDLFFGRSDVPCFQNPEIRHFRPQSFMITPARHARSPASFCGGAPVDRA
jgi:hypothetical protein